MTVAPEVLDRRWRRERARTEILERLIEDKTRELYLVNEELRCQNDTLEAQVEARTVEMRAALEAAQMASNAKTGFLAQMSHELRTPLHGLSGTVDLLGRTQLTAEQRRLVELCQGSSQALLKVIGDVLDYSRIEAGRVQLELRPIAPARVVADTVAAFTALAAQRGLQLRAEVAVPEGTFVLGDSHRLGQCLNNLVSNAVKFTERGEVVVRLTAEPVEAGLRLRWQVADTGCGMNEVGLARLFEPFTQAEAAVTRRFGGTGLGVSIVHGLVELMGGAIDVTSAVGVGTTFTLTTTHDIAAAPVAIASTHVDAGAWAGLRVLVVDDHPVNRLVAEAMLAELGGEVTQVEGGQQAIDSVAAKAPDIVLMDCHMPGMSGMAAARVIRRRGYQGPIVAVTADVSPENRAKVDEAGMRALLGKPFRREELLQMLQAMVPAEVRARLAANAPKPKPVAPTATPAPAAPVAAGAPAAAVPTFDEAAALAGVGGRRALLVRLAKVFLDELGNSVETLRRAMMAGDTDGQRKAAHALKGACAVVHLKQLRELVAWLEEEGKASRCQPGELPRLQALASASAVALESFLDRTS